MSGRFDSLIADLERKKRVLVWRLVWHLIALAAMVVSLTWSVQSYLAGNTDRALLFLIVGYLIGIEQRLISKEEKP